MSQLFKNKVPSSILFDFLIKYAINHDDYYVFDKNSYKTAKYHNDTTAFLSNIKEYYHNSKQFYAVRSDTYNNLLTVIRQICKYNTIAYAACKTYIKSSYNIYYNIYKQ